MQWDKRMIIQKEKLSAIFYKLNMQMWISKASLIICQDFNEIIKFH